MSDSKCCVCNKAQSVADNQLLRCSDRNCGITVHQRCYGVEHIPQHKWFCKKCEPFSMIRAAKVRCRFCPLKDGAFKPTCVDAKKEDWAHILCALWIPGITFDDNVSRNMIDLSKYHAADQATCMLCIEEGRHALAATGACISCSTVGCPKKFHVTCAHKRGLLNLSAIEGQASGKKSGLTARCSVCMMKKTGGPTSGKQLDSAERDRSGTPHTKPAQTKTSAQGMHSGVSKAPNLQRPKGAATTYMCRIPGCERSYFSEQGVKYHMKHHHTAADLADAPVVRSVSKETSAAQDKASATSTSASVSTPNVTSTASKGATASSERNHRGSYDGETESGGDAKRRKVGDRTRSMTSRVLPRIGRAKDLPCYKSAVSLIGGRNFGGMSTVEGKGVYRTLVKRAAGDELERNTVDVLHRLEDLQCKTIQVIEDVGALQAERASLLDETPDESGHGKRGANAEDDPDAITASDTAALNELAEDSDALRLVLSMVLEAVGLPHSVAHAVELDHAVALVNHAVANVPRGTSMLSAIQRALQSTQL
eukprot:m.730852 g.730852  ORF g.730852 m.730852 type:complete len:538 (+) comp23057_c0_seq2:168-1781(+)